MNDLPQSSAFGPETVLPTVTLWDWRRRVSDLYGAVRAAADPQSAWRLWRAGREELFRLHPQTPLEAGAQVPGYYDYNPAYRFAVALAEPLSDEPMALPAGRDGSVQLTPFALTQGLAEKLGGELTLYWLGGYGGGVFLPFLDATNGKDTYAGGRYLLDTIKSADLGTTPDGRIILDFNFAYNPSCSYSSRWTCPLAPRVNRLPAAIEAGEIAC